MPKTLLLADDSVTIQKVVGITFANEDVELVTVDNGADALARAKDLKPDLIMADVAMPGLGGYELCAAIRRDPELSNIPVLLLTGTFEAYDEQRALSVGASGHIAKPFEAQSLISQFYALVDQDATRIVDPTAARRAAAKPQAAPAPPAAAPAHPPAAAPAHPPAAASARPQAAAPARPQASAAARPTAPQPRPAAAAPAAPPARRPAATLQPDALDLPDLPNTNFSPRHAAPAPARAAAPARPAAAAAAVPRSPLVADKNAVPSMPDLSAPDDFSFSDLDFNESTPANANTDSGIFGEDSSSGAGFDAPDAAESDYNETAFLDPNAALRAVHAGPGADPLADTIPEDPFGDPNEDTSTFYQPMIERLNPARPAAPAARPAARPSAAQAIEEAIPWADATPKPKAPAPAARPSAAPAAPFIDALMAAAPVHAARTAATAEPETLEAEPFDALSESDTAPLDAEPLEIEPEDDDDFPLEAATVAAPEAFEAAAARFRQRDSELFAPEPEPEGELLNADETEPMGAVGGVRLDPADVRNAIEKVAWEAFGALQEQLMREVTARAEAALWEILPQIAERLIKEEITRLKSES